MVKVKIPKKENNAKELAFTESRVLRDEAIGSNNADFLDKIKSVQYLNEDMIMSIDQIANYYDVSKNTIGTIIMRSREEFESDGMKVLIGDELKQFKIIVNNKFKVNSHIPSLTVLGRNSLIRMAFILNNNHIATRVRENLKIFDYSLYVKLVNFNSFNNYIKKYEIEIETLLHKLLHPHHKIVSQVICGKYKIDFVINGNIAIEVDEYGHSTYDKNNECLRETFIKSQGYKLLRYDTRNNDVLNFMNKVIHMIYN